MIFSYLDANLDARECLLSFVIILKNRLEKKDFIKVNIAEHIYNSVSKMEFKEIFYDQINEIEGFNQHLLEVTIVKMGVPDNKDEIECFEIIEIKGTEA